MARKEHVEVLEQGREAWNAWIKRRYPKKGRILPGDHLQDAIAKVDDADLSGLDLEGRDLSDYDLRYVNLERANLKGANLRNCYLYKARLADSSLEKANAAYIQAYYTDFSGTQCSSVILRKAHLRRARFLNANLSKSDLSQSDLSHANLSGSNLYQADLRGASLEAVRMIQARLVETDFTGAKIDGCAVYGASVWNVKLDGASQRNFVITPKKQPQIIVDNLEVAQFIFLLIQNSKIRDIIDTVTAKAVLILGRFSAERKPVLEAIKAELRNRGYLPILFDFAGPQSRDLTETISTLAHIARFVVADITDPRSAPQELQRIVPQLPSVPVLPLLHDGSGEYGMFEHFKRYPWVLAPFVYKNQEDVVGNLNKSIIRPAEGALARLKSDSAGDA